MGSPNMSVLQLWILGHTWGLLHFTISNSSHSTPHSLYCLYKSSFDDDLCPPSSPFVLYLSTHHSFCLCTQTNFSLSLTLNLSSSDLSILCSCCPSPIYVIHLLVLLAFFSFILLFSLQFYWLSGDYWVLKIHPVHVQNSITFSKMNGIVFSARYS